MCGLLPLGLSWASLVVFGCIMCAALRSAKARFCLLVATLTLMMAWVWAGILLAALHPVFSLALLLSLVACWGTGRMILPSVASLDQSACGFLEHARRRRLPRDLRKQCKHAAKQKRALIFQLGSRCLLFLRLGQRCLELIYCACCLRLVYVTGVLLYMGFSFLLYFFQALRICLTAAMLAMCLYAHIFTLCLLLETPVLCAARDMLRRHFQHFPLFIMAMAADPGRGCVLGLLWICDLHFLTPRACECWSMAAYVAATTTRDSTASSVYVSALCGFLFPAFPPKAVTKKPSAQLQSIVKTPAAASLPVPAAVHADDRISVSVEYTAEGSTTEHRFRVRNRSRPALDRAQELLCFLRDCDLFKTSYWTQKQFKEDVFYALEVAVRPEFQKEKRSFSVRRHVWVQATQKKTDLHRTLSFPSCLSPGDSVR